MIIKFFSYDKNGNRLTYDSYVQTDSTAYFYGPDTLRSAQTVGNHLDSLRTGVGPTFPMEYDASGNLWKDTRTGFWYNYDCYNQLNRARWGKPDSSHTLWFGYSTAGQRVYKNHYHYYTIENCDDPYEEPDPGGVVYRSPSFPPPDDDNCYFHDTTYTRYVRGKGKVLAEYVDGGHIAGFNLKNTYIYAGDQRIAMIDRFGTTHFYLNDHLGSARVIVAENGTIKDKYEYFAFGAPDSQTVSTNQAYRYTNKPFDEEGRFDLYYYGARYYDPSTGRFTQVDPMRGKYPAWGPYVYCADNPLRNIDPDGRDTRRGYEEKERELGYSNGSSSSSSATITALRNEAVPVATGFMTAAQNRAHSGLSTASTGAKNTSTILGSTGSGLLICPGTQSAAVPVLAGATGASIAHVTLEAGKQLVKPKGGGWSDVGILAVTEGAGMLLNVGKMVKTVKNISSVNAKQLTGLGNLFWSVISTAVTSSTSADGGDNGDPEPEPNEGE